MNKTTTHKDSLDYAGLPLEDHELDSVSGGQRAAADEQSTALNAFIAIVSKLTEL